jgi:imidazolonepropionase-like amidohydrolase
MEHVPGLQGLNPLVFLAVPAAMGCSSKQPPGPETGPPEYGGGSTEAGDSQSGESEESETGSLPVPGLLLRNLSILGSGPYTGQRADILIRDGAIASIGDIGERHADERDLDGHWVVPAFIDSHVHFAYLPKSEEMLDGGICAAVDLAAPESFLSADLGPMRLIRSGPMITSELGYPTQGWGSAGYGIQCATTECMQTNIARLAAGGASVVKMPLVEPALSEELLAAGVGKAHSLDLKVASHALGDAAAALAARSGVDVLAHCPTGPLSAETVELWSEKAVISTLAAFGGSEAAIGNLGNLHRSGAAILYGTDFGNSSETGISAAELGLLIQAGLDASEMISSGTSLPAEWWGFEDIGRIDEGYRASFMVYSADPLLDPMRLAAPSEVWIDGQRRGQ